MASGRFGKVNLAANADTDIYTCPAGMVATASVCFANRTETPIKVRLAVRNGAISLPDYIYYDVTCPANGILERTQVVLGAGEIITVRADAAGMSVRAHGFEETQ